MKKILSVILLLAIVASIIPAAMINLAAADEYPDVKWNSGMFVGSVYNCYGLKAQYGPSTSYAATDVFTVSKAGTKLTFTDPKAAYATNSVLVVSSWKKDNSNNWVLDLENASYAGTGGTYASAVSTLSTAKGVTYTYITSKDNENLRLCYSRGTETVHPVVTFSEVNQRGTWDTTLDNKIKDIPVPKTNILGFDIAADTITTEWYYGYVGSSAHTSKAYTIVEASMFYLYSDVVTIEKAGTTIYLFDDTQVDGADSKYATVGAAIFSHWKKSGSKWVIDKEKSDFDGTTANTLMYDNFKMYYYTTTEDNENLRFSYRAGNADLGVEPTIYPIYILGGYSDYTVETSIGVLKDQSFKKADNNVINYKIYLPENYSTDNKYKLIFNVGEDLSLITEAVNSKGTMIVASFDGELSTASEVLEFIAYNYSVNKSCIYLTGDKSLHEKYPNAFVANLENASSYDSAISALKDMLSNKPSYYKALEGLTMYAIGDSYFQGSGIGKELTWPSLLASKYYMGHENYGVGGNTIGYFSGVNTTTQLPICDRYKTMSNDNADIILLQGGRNDRSKKIPFGTNDSKDKNTFKGALNVAISGLLEKYPNALIVCVTPWNYMDSTGATGGYAGTTFDYAQKMIELVEYLNNDRVVCVNAADKNLTGVDMNSASFRLEYSNTPSDMSHLNHKGMEMVLPVFEKFIAEAYMKYINYEDIELAPDFMIDKTSFDTTAEPGDNTTINESNPGCSCGNSTPSMFIAVVTVVAAIGICFMAKRKF